MKLVAVSIIKNEADILEAFVRHTHAWVDHHLIFDHDSTDGTREILGALAREGLPLVLFTDDALGNLQQARSNELTRIAAREFGADWVLPLDADEFLVAPSRAALEVALGTPASGQPVTLPLGNYYPTELDDAGVVNPVLRIQHRASLTTASRKVMISSALAGDASVLAGKGSHALYRGDVALPDRAAPSGIHLAHYALRSPGQQVLRVVTAELQKLGRGQAHAGLDLHYRLGFQLLAEHPDLFFQTLHSRAKDLVREAAPYLGGELRHTPASDDWKRVARALLPFLEKLARSHGDLVDRVGGATDTAADSAAVRPLSIATIGQIAGGDRPYFEGFDALEGFGPREGPFAGAFLPEFHWGTAPRTTLRVTSSQARSARLLAEALTYWEAQAVTVVLNGAELRRFPFPRVHQKEMLDVALPLQAGDNTLELRYDRFHASAADPRKLAVIFLSLRVASDSP